ncbi:hypothetical protein [Terribacillus saccharophilus]|uniref:DUF2798 domain-containing protein n=1 Tax=Terribacillus saccharophilus TaxID=361277 RepID=A0AAX2EIC4_9BACI|nr:hypothetical protein [Terribacillus goriensis]MEC0283993.1 hypothetical protein [Terribacillus saccharophilus]MEC0289886.1 hypothetical protein [Terribacillus saccharophilus]SEN79463.1 hypothetical protein SAMN04489762_2858 [Terribacillus saccharophilus]
MSVKGMIVGAAFSIMAAVLCAFVFGVVVSSSFLMAGSSIMYIGVFLQIIVPFLVVFSIAGAQFQRIDQVSEGVKWLISIMMAFIVITYAGTLGSLTTHVIVWGDKLENLAVGDIIVWGFIYGFLLLPLAAPVGRWLIFLLVNCCKYFEDSKEGDIQI